MAMVQMNVRIDEQLKAGGDAVLAHEGVTASEAVRALWRYLAAWEALPGPLARLVGREAFDEASESEAAASAPPNPVDEFYAAMGLAASPLADEDIALLREELEEERLASWEAL